MIDDLWISCVGLFYCGNFAVVVFSGRVLVSVSGPACPIDVVLKFRQ